MALYIFYIIIIFELIIDFDVISADREIISAFAAVC